MDDNSPHAASAALSSLPHNKKLIEEPDVRTLIFNAQSPYKLAFQNFLFKEVLPKLRREGFYALPNANV